MKSLKYLNKFFFRYKWRLLFGILFVGLSNYFGVKSLSLTGHGIDIIRKHLQDYPVSTTQSNQLLISALTSQVLLIIGWALISGFFLFLTRQTIIVLSRHIEFDMKNEIYCHYQELDAAFYKRNSTGDMMNRISEDVSRVRMYTGPATMYFINTFFSFLFTIIEMTSKDATLAVYCLLPLPVLAITIYFISDTIYKKSTAVQEQLSTITTYTQEAFSGIRILKAYGREQYSGFEFEKASGEYRNRNMRLVRVEALFQPFIMALIGLSVILIVYFGGLQYFRGAISIGSIVAFLLYINRLTWPIASLGWVTSLIQRAAASQARINEFLQTVPEIVSESTASVRLYGDIRFENVSFTYPDSGLLALDKINFTIPQGSSLAIIGRTGAGKSTIANLLLRLYDADSGRITIGGQDIRTMNLSSLRSQMGYVPQEVFLFSDTIAHNIAFSVDAGRQEQDEIEQAAKDAVIYDNISQFPLGFETVIGERGITLSGGQKQRISIARAIIRKPAVLVFDDCLSAVDTETEEKILGNLKRLMSGKTALIISHRISSVKNADNILVIEHGQIVEEGNHQQLLAKGGHYAGLYRMQLLEEENGAS